MQTVGEKLFMWIHSHRMDQKKFAAKTGLSEAYVSQLVRGLRRAGLSAALKIERVTKIPAKDWLRQ